MAAEFTDGRAQILCLGDSITEQGWGCKGGLGWVALLSDAYRRRADVTNRGYGGYNTRSLTPVALQLLAQPRPQRLLLCTVFLGANDANSQPEQHVPLPEFTARMTALLVAAAAQAACVLCIGPGPVDNRRWPTRTNAAVAQYNDAAHAACAAARASAGAGAPPLLFCSLLAEATGTASGPSHAVIPEGSSILASSRAPPPAWVDLLSDGLHLSSAGNLALAGLVLKTLESQCPSAAPAALPLDMPPWALIPVDSGSAADAAFTPQALAAFRK